MRNLAVYRESSFEKTTRLVGLVLLAPLLLILALPVAVHIAQKPDTGASVHRLAVVSLVEDGPAEKAGLHLGDRILMIGDQEIDSMAGYYAALAGNIDRPEISITVARNGRKLTGTILPTHPHPAHLVRLYSQWAAGLSFLVIGWWVLSRRHDPVARNFFAVCMIFAFFLMDIPDLSSLTYMQAKGLLRDLLQLLLPAFFLRFFLQFPSPRHTQRGEPRRYRWLLLPGWILFAFDVALLLLVESPEDSPAMTWLEILFLSYTIPYFVGGLLVFARRIRRRDRPIQRTKMQVVLAGLVVGLVPFLVAVLQGNLTGDTSVASWQYLGFSLLLVPTSFGLAIMRYGALDKAFVIRVGLIYGFLTLLLLVSLIAIMAGLGYFLGQTFGVTPYPVLMAVLAAISLAIIPLRRVVQGWIDRAFYPSRQVNRVAMTRLADEMTGLINPEEVTGTLLLHLGNLFRPVSLVLFLRATRQDSPYLGYQLVAGHDPSLGPDAVQPRLRVSHELGPEAGLVTLLHRLRRPIFVEEIEDALFTGEVDEASLNLLTRFETNLVVPLISGNQLQGFLAFGAKDNQALYSQEDLTNLRTLAVQAASVLESRQLYRNLLQRKKLETELELARDIQAGLLPPKALNTDRYIVAGRNEPCRMVGGDYFDFFESADGKLVFAIADVAGKGIPAALQMTSLRAAFRLEVKNHDSASEIVNSLNAVVTAFATPGAFICFFCGMWNPDNGLLTYCNAGMDPPVLFRSDRAFHEPLRKGGPVLGVASDFKYREGVVPLQSGDRIFLYTDGLTEERNTAGEFFEAERLLDLVSSQLQATPERLLETIFSRVGEFGGPESSDDQTAMILEIK